MPQTINTNLASLNAQRNLSMSQSQLGTAMERLSSGMRVNSAKDDAAGLAIAERMNTQVRGMTVAMRNANDGISQAQVGEGALGSVSNLFQRMRELAVQSANATNSSSDRASLNQEFVQLAQEATRTLGGTQFNGQSILSTTSDSVFQIGANSSTDVDRLTVPAFNWAGNTNITGVLSTAVLEVLVGMFGKGNLLAAQELGCGGFADMVFFGHARYFPPNSGSERRRNQTAGSRISQRTASIFCKSSAGKIVPNASISSSSCATDVTPIMVLATCHLV